MMEQERFELVSAYLDGEVTPSQRREVEVLLATDPVAKHLYQRLLQLHSEFQRMPIPPKVEPVEIMVDRVFDKIDRRSKRKFVLGGTAIAALCIAFISGIISNSRTNILQLAEHSNSETVQIALNEPVIEIVNPNNVMLTINDPVLKIPQPPISPVKNQ
ncbi:MAG: transcriptional regulator [Okeania sp. SIO2G4]|uniref:anti-sigma factor family protein n=1 Tax=unclassified Okeania TaxID=2634635 RepID=UPI0013B87A82|nr:MULTISPECIES: transcriptional regulator [unclassified Okeania]NEP08408.1 transcriptional regulator [Okeania sp. SIO4D6]NEP73506.1 transcriptional regulator [Okeania sp. SIO2G5]NEP95979.1 transcriptional regulator [Okeania sp. SIO2F5]NEQ92929.1 transcriptional regulator [Okeania sp. SIO2G4]